MSERLKNLILIWAVALGSTLLLWVTVGMKTIYENFDGPYYAVVAKTFYDKAEIARQFSFPLPLEYYAAHLPLYPLLTRVVGMVFDNLLVSGVVVNVGATLLGASVIYLVWEKMKWGNPLLAALVWLFAWPRMWAVRSVGSPETLFVALIVLSLFTFSKGKYLWAGIFGALATLTKSPGILLFVAYGFVALQKYMETKKFDVKIWPVVFIALAGIVLGVIHQTQMADFWAYFHSGDNIHLQLLPFRVFDSSQSWVGDFWLEDIVWIYLASIVGVILAARKNKVWGWFGAVFLVTIFFVSHRDIGRYSLPLVPVFILGISDLLKRKEAIYILSFLTIPLFFYTVNFLAHNTVAISNFGPFFLSK